MPRLAKKRKEEEQERKQTIDDQLHMLRLWNAAKGGKEVIRDANTSG